MFIDTHCHMNIMAKKTFDVPLTMQEIESASIILEEADQQNVKQIINVATSLIESANCIALAKKYSTCFASVGIHPNDCTADWLTDFKEIEKQWFKKTNHQENKIVAIGECGIDKHYPDYNLKRQQDAFRAQIELALQYNLPVIVHTRDAGDETLRVLEEYKSNNLTGVIHCFSEDLSFAQTALSFGCVLGIGGPLTYPKNNTLRTVFSTVALEKIILETDAPYLAPQAFRGKQNGPKYIPVIAQFLAELRGITFEEVAQQTTQTAKTLFALP